MSLPWEDNIDPPHGSNFRPCSDLRAQIRSPANGQMLRFAPQQ